MTEFKLRIASDLHMEGNALYDLTNTDNADVLVLAGDICTTKSLKKCKPFFEKVSAEYEHVVYVFGNHELYGWMNPNDKEHFWVFQDFLKDLRNIHILENKVLELPGLRIAGATLWTDFDKGSLVPYAKQMLNDYRWGLNPEVVYDWHKESVEFLENAEADVVVTHHAPHYGSVHAKWRNFGGDTNYLFYTDLNAFMRKIKPKLWVHGHMHDNAEYMVGDTKVVCNPGGYGKENPAFINHKVITV